MTKPLFVLAPMDGMTRASFRTLCFGYGADGATTEMIQSLAFGRAKRRLSGPMLETLSRLPEEGELAAQLIGSQPSAMAASAERLTRLERFDAIEINMGCPNRKVVGSGNGAALMRDVPKAVEVMRSVIGNTDLPVRLKMRLGWDSESLAAFELAEAAEKLGFQRVTVHGRTREQMYGGEVDLRALRDICGAVTVPVFVNGAVHSAQDALTFLRQTGAAGVCIGRAALKQPWIFDDIRALREGQTPPVRLAGERIVLLIRLAERACLHRPEPVAVREMRKFGAWLLDGLMDADEVLTELNGIDNLAAFRGTMERYLERLTALNALEPRPEMARLRSLDTVHPQVQTEVCR